MAPSRTTEPARGAEEKPAREAPANPEPAEEAPPQPAAAPGGGWKAWLPLAVAVVAMPLCAYAVTNFLLIPRMQKTLRATGGIPAETATETASEKPAAAAEGGEGKAAPASGSKQTATLNKLLVNVAGTMGSRYLLSSMVLSGKGSDFVTKVAQNEPQLRDMASGLLSTKTIAELEKPGSRNVIRGELLAGFNSILGNSSVQDIYFTEFAIQ
jgi:flagellar FliL protein